MHKPTSPERRKRPGRADPAPSAPAFVTEPCFVLRTPLLPFDEILAWSEGVTAPRSLGDPTALEAAVASDTERLRSRLRRIVERPEVREAIFLSSPSLEEGLDAWAGEAESKRGLRVERSLVRYVTRMAGRPMPFGLFAGCAIGTHGETTRLQVGGLASLRRHTRLDMELLVNAVEKLALDPDLRER